MRQIRAHDLRHILVVEDDALLRDMIADILTEAGFATLQAACAGAALDMLYDQPDAADEIAAIVTDVDMPGDLDGLGLAARVNEIWPWIGVVVTSGAHRAALRALRPPALFLAKPFPAERLIAAVHSVMATELVAVPLAAS
jgi:DNA-binding NtrC family response regulator